MILSLQGVGRAFSNGRDRNVAVEDVSLDIQQGEFLCVIGPSGCGKSTLLNLMAGLERPDRGQVLVRGEPVRGPGPDRAVMFQEHALFPWRTVAGNVSYPLEQLGWKRERIAQRVEELLRLVHLARFAKSNVHELSGGMRQRVALARALAGDPDILLMDEPFAALDAQTREVLLMELQRLWQSSGKTVVFVTHNVREAVVLGTKVALMATRPGRIQRVLQVDLPRPRSVEDRDVTLVAASMNQHLKAEIERVLREELGDDYRAPEGRLVRPAGGPLGSGI
ncbi:MAG: ABC transporter ATP-binding protein [Myxococcales bacterium]|nr:ABC transporter ATP-binding protein [Myxococcales bacterium]